MDMLYFFVNNSAGSGLKIVLSFKNLTIRFAKPSSNGFTTGVANALNRVLQKPVQKRKNELIKPDIKKFFLIMNKFMKCLI